MKTKILLFLYGAMIVASLVFLWLSSNSIVVTFTPLVVVGLNVYKVFKEADEAVATAIMMLIAVAAAHAVILNGWTSLPKQPFYMLLSAICNLASIFVAKGMDASKKSKLISSD